MGSVRRDNSGIGDITPAVTIALTSRDPRDTSRFASWLMLGTSLPTGDEGTALPVGLPTGAQFTRLGTGTFDPIIRFINQYHGFELSIFFRYPGGYNKFNYRTGETLSLEVSERFDLTEKFAVKTGFVYANKEADATGSDRVESTALSKITASLNLTARVGMFSPYVGFSIPVRYDVSGTQLVQDYQLSVGIVIEFASQQKADH